MADTAENGVVNDKGQVFSGTSGNQVYSNLYVCDGAIVPNSVGVNSEFFGTRHTESGESTLDNLCIGRTNLCSDGKRQWMDN
jgi:hypothetical protein